MTNDSFRANIVGNSPELISVINAARLVSRTDVNVLIKGECGTGKELLANAIHQTSSRATKPFVVVNCASIPGNHAESALFGYRENGHLHSGSLGKAHHGSLVLDEVSEMPANLQAKMLRFLESGEFQAVGSGQSTRVDVRILATTHKDLYKLASQGVFREDLYFRLNVVPLTLPALQDRGSDIELITRYYLNTFSSQYGLLKPSLSNRALKALIKYRWPGNIRELRNLCERLVILQQGKEITLQHLPAEITAVPQPDQQCHFSLPDCGIKWFDLEKRIIRQALEKANGNRSRAARLVGLSRDTFLYRMKKHTIEA